MVKPAQEPYILDDALRLIRQYSGREIQAQDICRLARDGIACLICKYEKHPLAVELQSQMVEHAIRSYLIANPQRG